MLTVSSPTAFSTFIVRDNITLTKVRAAPFVFFSPPSSKLWHIFSYHIE
jgi:hypothetical protein